MPDDTSTCNTSNNPTATTEKHDRKRPIEIIRHFTPSWFSVTMGTGILSILVQNFPFPFHGIHTIALVLYLLNVVIYCTFSLMTIIRYILFPSIFPLMLKHASQSLFIGTIPMGLTTITNFTILVIMPQFSWGSPLALTLWAIELVLTVFSCIGVPYYMIVHHAHHMEAMNGTWLLPIVPAVVTAASGGLLANHLTDSNTAFVVLIISYVMMGMGLFLALSIIVLYFYRLTVHKLPAKEVIISSFLPLGPLGQGAYGLIQLGSASQKIFGNNKYISGLGDTSYGVGFLVALMLWGYGVWYLFVAIFSVATTIKYKIPFNMGWWGLTFPLGVFISATLSIGDVLQSMFFHVLAAILICILVLIWLAVVIKTLKGAFTGEMFFAPCLTPVIINSS